MIVCRILCFFLGHRWRTVLINWPKFCGLVHLHPQAGCWSICLRCREEWSDLYYTGIARGCENITEAPPELELMEYKQRE